MWDKLIACGHLGSDPEMRYLESGTPVTTFSLAVTRGAGENKSTLWYRVTCWSKTAENVAQYSGKGDVVLVEGQLQPPQIWTDREGKPRCTLEINAREVRFISRKRQEKPDGAQAAAVATQATATATADLGDAW